MLGNFAFNWAEKHFMVLATTLVGFFALLAQAQPSAESELRSAYSRSPALWPAPTVDEGVHFVELGAHLPKKSSEIAHERQLAQLGERLFFDRRLSADGQVSCATCHRPAQGWTVHNAVGIGHMGQAGRRNPPALHASVVQKQWAWDGRSHLLAEQSLRPFVDPLEMGHTSKEALLKKFASLPDLATRFLPFATDQNAWYPVAGVALAAFVGTLHQSTRFDRFVQGDYQSLSDTEIHGLHLFRTRARCVNCHFGPALSDGIFHNLGIAFYGDISQDLGRYLVTGRCDDAGRFRTPSLRHISQTAPYMHNGLFASLTGVLHFYARGGGDPRIRNAREAADPLRQCAISVSPLLAPFSLSASELQSILAFLGTL